MKLIKIIAVVFLCSTAAVSAATLTTHNFIVTISQNCAEGNVTCDEVTYHSVSKKTGDSIKLEGTTWHTMASDGVTPSGFLGYKFKNGNITYYVLETGELEVIRGDSEVLLYETGTWEY